MPVLFLSHRYSEDSINLRRAALEAGWRVERLVKWQAPEVGADEDIALYGEPLFGAFLEQALSISLLEPRFDWLAELPQRYRQREIGSCRLEEARLLPKACFVKPAEEKSFAAKVYASGAEIPYLRGISERVMVLTSEPVRWEVEFRCFVLNRELVDCSPYIRNGEIAVDETGRWVASDEEYAGARGCIQELLNDPDVSLPAAIVVDVGLIYGGGWAVVEANAAWASGLCGCAPERILSVLQRCCVPSSKLLAEDLPWIIDRTQNDA